MIFFTLAFIYFLFFSSTLISNLLFFKVTLFFKKNKKFIENLKGEKNKNNSKKYGGIYYTKKKEKVKSKSEKNLANFFFEKKIKYVYEKELFIYGKKVANPDFYLIDYNCWIEFFGMTGISSYDIITRFKKRKYKGYKLNFIYLEGEDLYSNINKRNIFNKIKLTKILYQKGLIKGLKIKELE